MNCIQTAGSGELTLELLSSRAGFTVQAFTSVILLSYPVSATDFLKLDLGPNAVEKQSKAAETS